MSRSPIADRPATQSPPDLRSGVTTSARRVAQIVENARLHAEVAQALAYRERVMGVLGHDLRNPVTAVLSLSRTLAERFNGAVWGVV